MRTIGGGTVRYVDVRLLPCPEDPMRVGHCEWPGQIDILWHDSVVESFELRAGDELAVADGAEVAPDTELLANDPWSRLLRAAIPEGIEAIVHWSEPIDEVTDDVTGMTRVRFKQGPVTLTLHEHDGTAPLATYTVERDAAPLVETGAIVRRGDRLASMPRFRTRRELTADVETVRAWLDARPLDDEPRALIAPYDATVIDIDQHMIVLRSTAGRMLQLRRRSHAYVLVAVGDAVHAGDPLTDGERDHHALLHAWGADRFSEHLLDELELVCGRRAVPRVYWALVVRAMLADSRLRGIGALARETRRKNG
jgi:hypothetical protein